MKTRELLDNEARKAEMNRAEFGMDFWRIVHDVADERDYKNLAKYANERRIEKAGNYLFALFESLIDAIIK